MLMNHPAGGMPVSDSLRGPYGNLPLKVQVAALPWRRTDGRIEILLITSRATGRWVLPKGWPEKNETYWEAAAREAGEEAGISGSVETEEAGRYLYAKVRATAGDIACEVHVFPLKVKNLAGKWKEARQRTRRWMNGAEAAAAVREPDLAALIEDFCRRARAKAA